MTIYRVSVVVCARWETEAIVEWIEYYKSVGFEHIYLYSNDDDPGELMGVILPYILGESPFITYHHFPYVGQQWAMYRHFLLNHKDETTWCSFLDVDEFLNLNGKSIGRFLDDYEYADSIYLNWINFGTNGYESRPTGLVLENYVRRERGVHVNTKNIFKLSALDIDEVTSLENRNIFWHGWFDLKKFSMKNVNVLHDDMTDYYTDFPKNATRYLTTEKCEQILECARLHHYSNKSAVDFERRIARGAIGDFYGQNKWKTISSAELSQLLDRTNAVEDRSLSGYWHKQINKSVIPCMPVPTSALISTGKSARASSVSQWSTSLDLQEDATLAVNGPIGNSCVFHTDEEWCPWWLLDLNENHLIDEVWVFNRIDNYALARRASGISLATSENGTDFIARYQYLSTEPFGGADGNPLIIRFGQPIKARYLRLSLDGKKVLHLNQVRVYGSLCSPLGR